MMSVERPVSRARPETLRHQIRRTIAAEIASGEYGPGDRLPTEHEYARRFGVSLSPVRQALLDLVAAGQLVRIKARGTFVRQPSLEEEITPLVGFTDNLRQLGVPFEIRVLAQGLLPASVNVAKALELKPGSPVVHLQRLALIRGEPAVILDAYLPAERFPSLANEDAFGAAQSLYRHLETEYGTRLRRSQGTLQVVSCDDTQGELLGVPVSSPAMLIRSVLTDDSGVPVESAHVLYRADRFVFRLERTRVSGRSTATRRRRNSLPGQRKVRDPRA